MVLEYQWLIHHFVLTWIFMGHHGSSMAPHLQVDDSEGLDLFFRVSHDGPEGNKKAAQ
jgi:hypothetical protein